MISTNIHTLRQKQGLSITQLSYKAKISKSHLSSIERNLTQNPSIQVLEKIASGLNVELSDLLSDDPTTETSSHRDQEMLDFLKDLKASGVQSNDLKEFKTFLEYIKWKKSESDA